MRGTRGMRAGIAGLWAAGAVACSSGDDLALREYDPARHTEPGENRPPVVERVHLDPAEPLPGQRVRAVVLASDPDGDPVEIHYAWTVDDLPLDETGSEVVLGDVSKGEWIGVEVIASDGQSESDPGSAHARVPNRPPALLGIRLEPAPLVPSGENVVAVALGEDADDDPLEYHYAWRVNDQPVDETGPSLATEGLRRGDRIQVRVVASDGEHDSDPMESIAVEMANANPRILSDPTGFDEDGSFSYQLEADDPDGDRNLRYSLRQGPEGMRVDPILGTVRWRPTPEQAGPHEVAVAVEDPKGAATVQRFDLDVTVGAAP